MNQERAIPGTPGKSADALLGPLSDALERLRTRMLSPEGYMISPSEVNALNNLQGVLLVLSQGALPEVRTALSARILRETQPLLLLAGLMVSLKELSSSSSPSELTPSTSSEPLPTSGG